MRTLAILAAIASLAHAEPLDRIAVTVGTQVITESALILDLRVGAFLDRGPIDTSAAAKRRAAERLVDQSLILREATDSHLALPTSKEAVEVLNNIKAQFGPPQEFQSALQRYGIHEADVTAQLLAGLIGITFTDLRFRPAVQIPEEDLRAYYSKLVTQEQGSEVGSFEANRDRIEDLLTRQRTTEALDQWLVTARANARVEFRPQVFP
jgi:hypothetical protein